MPYCNEWVQRIQSAYPSLSRYLFPQLLSHAKCTVSIGNGFFFFLIIFWFCLIFRYWKHYHELVTYFWVIEMWVFSFLLQGFQGCWWVYYILLIANSWWYFYLFIGCCFLHYLGSFEEFEFLLLIWLWECCIYQINNVIVGLAMISQWI